MDWRAAYMARASGLAGGRVYWGERPQTSALPALLFTSASDDRPQTLKDWDLAPGRIQIDAFAANAKAAWDLIESAITTLVPGDITNGHIFHRAEVALGPRDLHERIGSTTVFRVSTDLIVYHTETDLIS